MMLHIYKLKHISIYIYIYILKSDNFVVIGSIPLYNSIHMMVSINGGTPFHFLNTDLPASGGLPWIGNPDSSPRRKAMKDRNHSRL